MKHNAVTVPLLLLLATLGLSLGYSCSKSTPFGEDLFKDEVADFVYTDTLTVQFTVLPKDSVITSDVNSVSDYFLCGQLFDPVFGKSQSDLYTLLRLSRLGPNLKNTVVDSVVMFLNYAASGFYGDTTQPQTLRVHRLAQGEQLQWGRVYYDNSTLQVGDQIGELANFLPQPNTSRTLFDTTTRAPYVRIPLDNAFGQELLNTDSVDMTADTLFWKKIRGLRITAESQAQPGAMMAFDLNNNSFSLIRVYFKRDTTASFYDYNFLGGNKFTHYSRDYTGSAVEPYLEQKADDRLFIQGMGGLCLKMEVPYAHLLGNVAINKAELELTAEGLPGDNPLLRNVSQMIFTESAGNSDNDSLQIIDVLYSRGGTLTGGFVDFGGFPVAEKDQGVDVQRYRLTLTQRFQAMVDNESGDIKDQTLYINVYPQLLSAMRGVFYGPKSNTFPAKLTLKYTKVR